MPKKGDYFIVELKQSHLGWGNVRKTNSRRIINGEGYLPIPAKHAKALTITNSNGSGNTRYNCNSVDGIIKNKILLAQGASRKGYIYAKNFAGEGNLKLLGLWFKQIGAKLGDKVKIEFTSSTEVSIEKL